MLQDLGYETEGHTRRLSPLARWGRAAHSRIVETLVKLNTQTSEDLGATVWEMSKAAIRARRRRSETRQEGQASTELEI